MLADIKEIKQLGARVIALVVEGDEAVAKIADHTILIPPAPELLLPMVEIVPLQLLAYHIAVARGCNVDQPRNLVKAVIS
jgi:glucosamine--fructose-6-phosphate aminotransferase (isomerizing)